MLKVGDVYVLSQRQRAILATLIEHGDFVTVGDLARQQGVTERTIRNDLEAIESFLSGTAYRLERHKRRGARLQIPLAERTAWLERLRPTGDVTYRLSAEERQRAILAAFLRRSAPLSLGRLADELFVSRRTVVEDLKKVEAWLKERGLRLLRLPSGVTVEGPEGAWRAALAELISPAPGELARRPLPMPFPLLPPEEMAAIRQAVTRAAEALPYELADVAYEGLVYHLAVAILRLRSGHDIVMDPEELSGLEKRPEWDVAGRLAEELERRLQVRIPPGERGYVTLHLLGAKAIGPRTRPEVEGPDASLEEAVDAFLRAAGAHLGVDLTGDEDLLRGLLLHLRPAVYRLRYGLRLVNPLRDQIMERYGFLMAAVQAAAPVLEERLGIHITGDELSYLAMHVGAHLERVSARRPARVLLVCGSGIGTARLLQSRMARVFPHVQVVGVLPAARLGADSLQQADLIISTVPLAAGSKPVVVVNPFLTPEDVRLIRQALAGEGGSTALERMMGPMLDEVLSPELIRLDVEARDWEEAIRLAGEPLVAAGRVEPRFVDAMVEAVRRIGPYIVVDPGVAMPHARPEDGVRSVGFSLVRLREPIPFGHRANDPVRLVFAIASPDAETHLRALAELAGLLSDPASRAVFEQGSVAEILAVIRQRSSVQGG